MSGILNFVKRIFGCEEKEEDRRRYSNVTVSSSYPTWQSGPVNRYIHFAHQSSDSQPTGPDSHRTATTISSSRPTPSPSAAPASGSSDASPSSLHHPTTSSYPSWQSRPDPSYTYRPRQSSYSQTTVPDGHWTATNVSSSRPTPSPLQAQSPSPSPSAAPAAGSSAVSPSSLHHPTTSSYPSWQSRPDPSYTYPPLQSSYSQPTAPDGHRTATNVSSSRPTPSPLQAQSPSPSPSAAPAAASSAKPPPSLHSPTTSSSIPSPSFKPILSVASSDSKRQEGKTNYVLLQNDALPIYSIPTNIEALIKRDIVPEVLKKPLSPSTYKDYFSALLYAEDYYMEKWSDFQLIDVTLKLHDALVHKKGKNARFNGNDEKDDKVFIEFEVDSVPERRPFLLSRDFVFARPSGSKAEPFQGIFYRVVNSTTVLVEFGEDFHSQHRSTRTYDVSFSFNRVCLKRAHQAIAAVSDPLFQNFIFPENVSRKSPPAASPPFLSCNHQFDMDQTSAVRWILSSQGSPPYIVKGPLCINATKYAKQMSRTGLVIREAVVEIYRLSPNCRILICAPINNTCDMLMRSLKTDIPEREMFRANAAFREIDGVPMDILPSCLYAGECFSCPSFQELKKYRVILSTFMSSFRLHNEGIRAGHFSHVFMVDASSATEPEALIALANFADEKTNVILSGSPGNCSGWIRSNIARKHGLRVSYFDRLCDCPPYRSLDPAFVTQLN